MHGSVRPALPMVGNGAGLSHFGRFLLIYESPPYASSCELSYETAYATLRIMREPQTSLMFRRPSLSATTTTNTHFHRVRLVS